MCGGTGVRPRRSPAGTVRTVADNDLEFETAFAEFTATAHTFLDETPCAHAEDWTFAAVLERES